MPGPAESGPRAGTPDDHEVDQRAREGAGRDGDGAEVREDELREVAAQLLNAPVSDVVANHCYGLFELAALHLSQTVPDLEKARLAIDAMGLLVDGLGARLGTEHDSLVEGLTQLRLAFVRISQSAPDLTGAGRPDGPGGPTGTDGQDGPDGPDGPDMAPGRHGSDRREHADPTTD